MIILWPTRQGGYVNLSKKKYSDAGVEKHERLTETRKRKLRLQLHETPAISDSSPLTPKARICTRARGPATGNVVKTEIMQLGDALSTGGVVADVRIQSGGSSTVSSAQATFKAEAGVEIDC